MSFEESQERIKTGRNDPCPCGSGKKYKKCHRVEDEQAVHAELRRREQAARDAAEAVSAEGEDEDENENDPQTKERGAAGKRPRAGNRGQDQSASRHRGGNTPPKNLPRRKAV